MTSPTGGSCSAEVTQAAPNVGDVVEGTFSGTVPRLSGGNIPSVTVTNGRFRATRSIDQPLP